MAVPALAKAPARAGEVLGLPGAAGGVGLGIEIEDQLAALEVGQRDFAAAVAGQAEGREPWRRRSSLCGHMPSFRRFRGVNAAIRLWVGRALAERLDFVRNPLRRQANRSAVPARTGVQTGGRGDARSGMTDKDSSPRSAGASGIGSGTGIAQRRRRAAGASTARPKRRASGSTRAPELNAPGACRKPGWRLPFNPWFMFDRRHPWCARSRSSALRSLRSC